MTRIEFAPAIRSDIDRIHEHLTRFEAADRGARIDAIFSAIDALAHNPLIGRRVEGEGATSDLRELVIGRGVHGYVALYQYFPALDVVLVAAIRAQREARYPNLPG